MPYQLSAKKFVIPYYVVTLDVTHAWDKSKDVLDPARYDMPEQDFDVAIGNLAGKGATITAYDPLAAKAVPVQVLSADAATLRVRLKAVDYPRVLIVEEAKDGPQILDPKVALDNKGNVTVSWSTNQPVEAKITYGQDWQNRGDKMLPAKPGAAKDGKYPFTVTLPETLTGVVAVRITIKDAANGLTTVWPRWDEDPQGQFVVPAKK